MNPEAQHVWVVTVTYGNRLSFVKTVVEAVLKMGVGRIVLVDNGCPATVREGLSALQAAWPEQLLIVHQEENLGSAGGYAVGIQTAYEGGAEFLWLLDDDNRPVSEALDRLLAAYRLLGTHPRNVLVGFRPSRKNQQKAVFKGHRIEHVSNTFLGFHIRQLSALLPRKKQLGPLPAPPLFPLIAIDYAPYGGLFLHRSWVERAGLPDHRLYLYADDYEYTRRLVEAGARLYLCAPAIIEDLDDSWHVQPNKSFPWVDPTIDIERLYYAIRNRAWLEKHYLTHRSVFLLNGAIFLGALCLVSLLREKNPRFTWQRMQTIWQALQDGWQGKLGRLRLASGS
ncbi:glycosyltransferase [Rhodothermus marinus]|uniref:glycosyltransferase n=1 Tax=Rhodothermus marinus TaxID=29549 RepID=UPI0037CB0088